MDIFKKIPKWIFQLLFVVFGLVLVNQYNKHEQQQDFSEPAFAAHENHATRVERRPVHGAQTLKITASAMCSDIVDQWPADVKKSFSRNAGKIYCFTLVEGAGEPTFVHHHWIYQNTRLAEYKVDVDSESWRTWSSLTLNPANTGNWRVEIVSPEAKILATLPFTVR